MSRQIIGEGNFLRIVRIAYEDNASKLQNWEAVERINHQGVTVIVPFTKEREFILIRQFRPLIGKFVVTFPTGLIDKNENVFDAAKRELIEETGYTSEKLIPLSEVPESSGMSTTVMTIMLAIDAAPASDKLKEENPPDENEDIEVIKTPINKIHETIESFQKKRRLC